MSPALTICIPAYRAEAFIRDTVNSVLAQTFEDFRVLIAIDPPGNGTTDRTQAALGDALSDPRITVTQNPQRLGWAENINQLLKRVETPFYAILPHDDLWLPEYLATLYPLVQLDAGASVAYADLILFGAAPPGSGRSVVLPQSEARQLHVLRFFLQGAHAMPWRGVTRTSSLRYTKGFPTDRFMGFAVECEYALSLLEAGKALHVPQALYRKRVFANERVSASMERLADTSPLQRELAWQRHRTEMLTRLDKLIIALDIAPDLALLCRHSAFAAMLKRRQDMVRPGLNGLDCAQINRAMEECLRSEHPMATEVEHQLRAL